MLQKSCLSVFLLHFAKPPRFGKEFRAALVFQEEFPERCRIIQVISHQVRVQCPDHQFICSQAIRSDMEHFLFVLVHRAVFSSEQLQLDTGDIPDTDQIARKYMASFPVG